MSSPIDFVHSAEISIPAAYRALREARPAIPDPSDLSNLPDTTVVAGTLVDFTNTQSAPIRHAVSLAMLFAYRFAAADATATSADSWLDSFHGALSQLGFRLQGSSKVENSVERTDVLVHKALIPFLTTALGGVSAGPAIIALLTQLNTMNKDSPWITLFESESKRYGVQEMHFAAVADKGAECEIRNVVARFDLGVDTVQFLFLKTSTIRAQLKSETQTMAGNTALLEQVAPAMEERLKNMALAFIRGAVLG